MVFSVVASSCHGLSEYSVSDAESGQLEVPIFFACPVETSSILALCTVLIVMLRVSKIPLIAANEAFCPTRGYHRS